MDFAKLEHRFAAATPTADLYLKCAALYYNVPESEVTAVQRQRTKRRAYSYAYENHRGEWPSYLQPLRDAMQSHVQVPQRDVTSRFPEQALAAALLSNRA